jgi:hypothetical protein
MYQWDVGPSTIMGVCIPSGNEGSLSLRDLYSQEDYDRDPRVGNRLAEALGEHGIRTVYAPSVAAMCGEIVAQENLISRIAVAPNVFLHRNRNIDADGVRISRRQAFAMSNAGCPAVITHGGSNTFAAHMGRKSAIDEDRIRGKTQRRFEGVLYALAAEYHRHKVPLNEVRVLLLFSIKPSDFTHPFNHPVHGHFNMKMHEYICRRWGEGIMREGDGQFSMPALAKAQAAKIGFGGFVSKCALPTLKSFASTRDPREPMAQSRNLTIIWRC